MLAPSHYGAINVLTVGVVFVAGVLIIAAAARVLGR
jgi:hypothetical protein